MIITNVTQRFPNCVKILSHAGGTLPFLVSRIAVTSQESEDTKKTYGKTYADIMDDLRSFYYDVALSSSPAVMKLLLELVPHEHITYGKSKVHNKTGKYLWVSIKARTFHMLLRTKLLGLGKDWTGFQ